MIVATSFYHQTLAQRIGWKWRSVLELLKKEGRLEGLPTDLKIKDWGCGTGIAGIETIAALGDHHSITITPSDRSSKAVRFAKKAIQEQFSGIQFSDEERGQDLLLISHVMTELNEGQLQKLVSELSHYPYVLWVEAGTSAVSHRMMKVRNQLLDRFQVMAPCPHQKDCPLTSGEDWCHFFAKAPQEAFTSKFWRDFADNLQIDVASLPSSYLFLGPKDLETHQCEGRVIGSIRRHKAYQEYLACRKDNLQPERAMKIKPPSKNSRRRGFVIR